MPKIIRNKRKERVLKSPLKDSNSKNPSSISEVKSLPDNIEEYFTRVEGTEKALTSKELFKADDVDLRTDLGGEEIKIINTMLFNDSLLKERGLKPVFSIFLNQYMRLKFSKDRKSRGEFVAMNKSSTEKDGDINLKDSLKNIGDSKK